MCAAEYYADIRLGQFISRPEMATLGLAMLLGATTISATVIAVRKFRGWITPEAVRYRGWEFVSGCAAAFICGMFVYLIVYPLTPWVFYSTMALAFVFGALLVIPMDRTRARSTVVLLDVLSCAAACVAGFAFHSLGLAVVGALGLVLSIVTGDGANRAGAEDAMTDT